MTPTDRRRIITFFAILVGAIALVLWIGATQDRDISRHPPGRVPSSVEATSIAPPTTPDSQFP